MLDADRPILGSHEDRLNRAQFAKYLARCLLDHKEKESLVVGLYGGFGTGKTSLLNMTVEELQNAAANLLDDEKPIILNFSPWSYSGQHQLIYSFFRRLSSAMRSVPYFENSERIIHLLELYVSFFTHKPVPTVLRAKQSLLEKMTFKHREDVYAWESGRDLTAVKAELNVLLRQQKHKIIIVIDNISRLYPEEIRQIFQIIKSMGDYANTLYLIAFDKQQVMNALNKIENGEAKNFLEKVIQLSFEVPPILQQDLEKIFVDRLLPIVGTVPNDSWDAEYWADIYYGGMKYFFQNCRDITRYVNTLSFSYQRFRDLVNPVDFFALTAIEVFLPSVYFGIRDNKDLFTDLLDNVYEFTQDQIQEEKQRCDEILARGERISQDVLLALLMILFPRLRKIYHPHDAFFYSDALARKLRCICSPDLFDVYFRLSMQSARIPETEFATILAAASDANVFDQILVSLNQDDRIDAFLDQLDSRVLDVIPRENIQSIINGLLDNGDLFPQGISGPLSVNTPMHIHRIVHTLLRRFEKTSDRFALLQQAIAQASKSLYIIIYELMEQSREHSSTSERPLEFRDLLSNELDSLSKLAVSRIERWAQNGSLETHPKLLPILLAWQMWSNNSGCQQYVEKLTNTDRGLIAFLLAVFEPAITQAMTVYEKNPDWQQYIATIELFIPPAQLIDHAKALFENNYFEKLREREQLGLMIFLDVMNVQTKKTIPKTTG